MHYRAQRPAKLFMLYLPTHNAYTLSKDPTEVCLSLKVQAAPPFEADELLTYPTT